jgi:hypothetical protein
MKTYLTVSRSQIEERQNHFGQPGLRPEPRERQKNLRAKTSPLERAVCKFPMLIFLPRIFLPLSHQTQKGIKPMDGVAIPRISSKAQGRS